jgi:hypothetical protein
MNVNSTNSAVGSAVGLFHSAQKKADEAAHDIATLPVTKEETGSTDFNSTEAFPAVRQLSESLMKLREAEHETSAAAKIFQTQDKMIGTLLDIKA